MVNGGAHIHCISILCIPLGLVGYIVLVELHSSINEPRSQAGVSAADNLSV